MLEKESIRLQKYLSQSWVCSRRKAEQLILEWNVFVNWIKAEIWQSIDPSVDKVTLWTKAVEESKKLVYYMLNKPYWIVTTCKTDWESSILDVMKVPERVFPVWRLDKNTTGLIILTNDGRLSNFLMHPRYEHEKEYIVQVYWKISDDALDKMSEWVYILWKKTKQALISRISSWMFSITIREWRNRQIRRMVEKVWHEVKKLKRIRIQTLSIWDLKEWEFRKLSQKELSRLWESIGLILQ